MTKREKGSRYSESEKEGGYKEWRRKDEARATERPRERGVVRSSYDPIARVDACPISQKIFDRRQVDRTYKFAPRDICALSVYA